MYFPLVIPFLANTSVEFLAYINLCLVMTDSLTIQSWEQIHVFHLCAGKVSCLMGVRGGGRKILGYITNMTYHLYVDCRNGEVAAGVNW